MMMMMMNDDGRSDSNYNFRPRRHNLVLTAKSFSVTDKDFITRIILQRHLITDDDIPLLLFNFTVCMHVHLGYRYF